MTRILCFIVLLLSGAALAQPITYTTVDWTDLLPDADLQGLENPPIIDHGTGPDQPVSSLDSMAPEANPIPSEDDFTESEWQRALTSDRIRPEWNGRTVRVPGFVVPLEFDDDMVIKEFFLVPYFGACIHMPPPPPNQIIHVKMAKGFTLDNLYEAFWVSGRLSTTSVRNDMAHAAYSMEAHSIKIYDQD